MNSNLKVLDQSPDFATVAIMSIQALAPLSMVAKMPGKYYRSQPAPTEMMLLGLMENALGWHISEKERNQILKQLKKQYGDPPFISGVNYIGLLQHHVRFSLAVAPSVRHYDDYWSQHLRGASFVGGSRDYDYRAIPLMNALADKREDIKIDDKGASDKNPDKLLSFQAGDRIHLSVVRPYFPQYYVSPTPREYVLPDGPYQYRVETSAKIAQMLAEAFDNPAAPLYLGSNDGWIDAQWRVMP